MKKYQKYVNSGVEWIGYIPAHWDKTFYKFHLSILSGFPFKSELFDPIDGFPVIRIRDITSGTTETFYKGDYDPDYIINKGDLLVGMDGDFTIRWWDGAPALLNQRCCSIKERPTMLRRFLYYLLPLELNVINDLTYFTTVKHLSSSDILNSSFAIPTLNEQSTIVNFLDQKTSIIDDLIQKKLRKIELLKEHRTSIINHAVTKGLNSVVRTKVSGVEWIGEIPEQWDVKKIKFIGNVFSGDSISSELITEDGNYPVYGGNGVLGYYSDCNFTKEILSIGRVGEKCGNVHLINQPVWINDNSLVLELVDDTAELKYLFYTLIIRDLNKLRNQNTQPLITGSLVKNEYIPFPAKTEQHQIVEYLDKKTSEIIKQVNLENRKIDLLKEYRQSLISEVVTGKIDVRTN